jgi:hypothetical protein
VPWGPLASGFLAGKYHLAGSLVLAAIVSGIAKIANAFTKSTASALADTRELSLVNVFAWLSVGVALVAVYVGARWGLAGVIYGVGLGWFVRAAVAFALIVRHLRLRIRSRPRFLTIRPRQREPHLARRRRQVPAQAASRPRTQSHIRSALVQLQRDVGRVLAVVGLLLVAVATLTPLDDPRGATLATSLFCLVCGDQGGADVASNLLLFVPFAVGFGSPGQSWVGPSPSRRPRPSPSTAPVRVVPGAMRASATCSPTISGAVGASLTPGSVAPTPAGR